MTRSCGLRIGPRRFELVVLDGSAKKHKVVATRTGEFPRPGPEQSPEEWTELSARALRDVLKEVGVPKDNVGIAIDSGMAAFRMLKMPFADRAKIEQVLKFETESLLPQWNIDEVVVDFHMLDSTDDSSELLVTAVQKSDLQRAIRLCERAGLEPLEAEIETTAMVNAALSTSVCSVDGAQLLVHVGEHSTSVVVVDGGKTREMRAIHIGVLSHEIVQASEKETKEGEEEGEKAEKKPAPEGGPATGTWLDAPVDPDELQRRLEQTIKRIRRELGRTLSATRTAHPIQGIYVCGLPVPGLIGSTILDLPVERLEFSVDGGPSGEEASAAFVAYGVALGQLGGGALKPSLRREELRYSGAFERIELPLAVVCLLLVTLLCVWNIFLRKETQVVDQKLAQWRNKSIEYLIGNPKAGNPGTLRYPSEAVKKYTSTIDEDTDRTKFEQVGRVKFLLDEELRKLAKDVGEDDIGQPQSALTALVLVLDVLEQSGTETARPSIRKIRSTYQNGKRAKSDKVRLAIDFTIFAGSQLEATQMLETFTGNLNKQPWIAARVETRSTDPLETGKGIYVENQIVEVDVSKAPKHEAARASQ
jgi:Tfp pilus assembly PilM family ATPase